jgi:hypothetical protein
MKIYLSGPMRGIKDFNFDAFHRFAQLLRGRGYIVFSPAERDVNEFGDIFKSPNGLITDLPVKFDLRKTLLKDIAWICNEADTIAMLPGWADSKGAVAEFAVAAALGLRVIYLKEPKENNEVLYQL